MNRTKLIRIFGGLILIIFVAMGASGGCEKNNNSNGGNDGDDNGTTFNGTTLGVCDLRAQIQSVRSARMTAIKLAVNSVNLHPAAGLSRV